MGRRRIRCLAYFGKIYVAGFDIHSSRVNEIRREEVHAYLNLNDVVKKFHPYVLTTSTPPKRLLKYARIAANLELSSFI